MPKDGHGGFGQAKPWVLTRLGAPRRLFTSGHRRTGAGAGPPPEEAVEARRQAGPSSGQRGGAGDDGASCAWPLLLRRKADDGTSKDAKGALERAEGRPRAGTRTHERTERSSLLEMGRRENSLRSKQKASLPCCQAIGSEVRIVHHRESLYQHFTGLGKQACSIVRTMPIF
jgi:hypothetical protein